MARQAPVPADAGCLRRPTTRYVVCFCYHPAGRAESELDDVNRRLSEALLDDCRVFAGGTVFGGQVRPQIEAGGRWRHLRICWLYR
jgi:hypothetical protein